MEQINEVMSSIHQLRAPLDSIIWRNFFQLPQKDNIGGWNT